jgi:hypothetical protein
MSALETELVPCERTFPVGDGELKTSGVNYAQGAINEELQLFVWTNGSRVCILDVSSDMTQFAKVGAEVIDGLDMAVHFLAWGPAGICPNLLAIGGAKGVFVYSVVKSAAANQFLSVNRIVHIACLAEDAAGAAGSNTTAATATPNQPISLKGMLWHPTDTACVLAVFDNRFARFFQIDLSTSRSPSQSAGAAVPMAKLASPVKVRHTRQRLGD